MYARRLFVVVATLFVLISLTTSMALAQDPDNGQVLWEEDVWQCANCHGAAGEGMWGPPLAGDDGSVQDWLDQVRNPRRNMPAFSEAQVSDEQLTDMHAYITALTEPDSFARSEADLPADAPEGQLLMADKNCIACHGETGPLRGYIERGETPTAEAVIAQLRTPRENMPSYSEDQVSDAEAALIADFMAAEVASQATPESLPQSGGLRVNYALLLMAGGVGLLAAGLVLRRRRPVVR